MASAIDPTKPAEGNPTTQSVRDNFGHAKSEIEALQSAIAALQAGALVKPGTIIDFAGTSAPDGYLACPLVPTNVSRTTYADLFNAIGTTWGAGDGSTTFGMPYFPEDEATIQANGNVGTSSVGAVISHNHRALLFPSGVGGSGGTPVRQDGTVWSYQVIEATGGAKNLAAGRRVMKCVKV